MKACGHPPRDGASREGLRHLRQTGTTPSAFGFLFPYIWLSLGTDASSCTMERKMKQRITRLRAPGGVAEDCKDATLRIHAGKTFANSEYAWVKPLPPVKCYVASSTSAVWTSLHKVVVAVHRWAYLSVFAL